MVPLYAARIEDLGPGDLVRVECAACGHDVLIPPRALLHGLRLALRKIGFYVSSISQSSPITQRSAESFPFNIPHSKSSL